VGYDDKGNVTPYTVLALATCLAPASVLLEQCPQLTMLQTYAVLEHQLVPRLAGVARASAAVPKRKAAQPVSRVLWESNGSDTM
jgi:hypothetical protein